MRNGLTTGFRRLFLRGDERAAARALGADHPLARTLALRHSLVVQLLTTSVPVVFALVGLTLHVRRAPIVLGAAALVGLGLCAVLYFVRQSMRERARELIAAGAEMHEVPPVQHERRRLATRRSREQLARSLESYLRDAEKWDEILPPYRPPLEVRCLRFVADEVRAVASRLRAESAHVRGVAAVAGFLTEGSPLFRGDVIRLRAELLRICDLLGGVADTDFARAAA
jgi:hypothetical protein